MRVTILGSGGPRPHPKRCAPAQLIINGDLLALVDCGPGTGHNMARCGLSFSKVDNVFLTHTHLDHCLELPAVVLAGYLEGRKGPVTVYGPEGTEGVVNALMTSAYAYIPTLVQKVTGVEVQVNVVELRDQSTMRLGTVSVSVADVDHNYPCVGYRFDAEDGSSVTFSGDTAPCDSLIRLATGARLLIHDCAFPDELHQVAKSSYHTVPFEVGEIASAAKTSQVALTHMFPACDGKEEEMIRSVRDKFAGEVFMAEDLQTFEL